MGEANLKNELSSALSLIHSREISWSLEMALGVRRGVANMIPIA